MAVDGRLEYGEWGAEGTRRHDYQVVGNVEFPSAPLAAEAQEPEPAKPARGAWKKQEPVAPYHHAPSGLVCLGADGPPNALLRA